MTASATTAAPSDIDPSGRRLGRAPQRAEGLQLLGDLPGSGYKQPPALARRQDGQLLKLTPLLYQLVDAIDGRRDCDELARDLSRRIGREAGANDVRFLVERKLMPLGLLELPDGSQPEVKRANPLLVLKPRIVLSNPKWTGRLAAPFVAFFNPLVVAPVIAAFAGLTWWLLTEKGFTSALHQAFYEPSMTLVLWGLIILSAAFHEIGHAAACRYGGGRPGVMGAGLYLAWPAFYTEVSDAYRLDRRGRLRVDLGGLYFNAIFSLVVAAVWSFTHADALLLIVAVQLIQMVRQLAPFIRADGYHIVSDLTGVPDLFAQIKPTLLGLLPTRWGRPEHQKLKPWARAVVSIWVLTVVPLLVGMLGYAVLMLPRLAATAWGSMGVQWAETTRYWAEGNPAGVVMSAVATAFVAMPVAGIVYLLGRIGRRSAVKTWHATAGSPGLRALALLGAAGVGAFVIWAWWPSDQYQAFGQVEAAPAQAALIPTASEMVQEPLGPLPQPATATLSAPMFLITQSVPVLNEITSAVEVTTTPAQRQRTKVSAYTGPVANCNPWPFPFAPPEAPATADNRAAACNTTDGKLLADIATSLLIAGGDDPVDQANEAHAYASCTRCRTIALAFQVILIVGYADEIRPVNGAVAANFECNRCDTEAFAYQLILTLTAMPSDQALQDIRRILGEVQGLDVASLSGRRINRALVEAERQILATIPESLVTGVNGSSTTSSSHSGSANYGSPPAPADEANAASLDNGSTDGSSTTHTDVTAETPSATTTTTTQDTTTSGQTTTTDSSTQGTADQTTMADQTTTTTTETTPTTTTTTTTTDTTPTTTTTDTTTTGTSP